jgi:DNA-binding response OmpR family regulator
LQMARNGNHDLIICDVILPHYNGKEICRLLREENIQTPVLILTALNFRQTGRVRFRCR